MLSPYMKETAMRILMAGVALTAVMMASGCASLSPYPAFGTLAGGGRTVVYERKTTGNLLPAARTAAVKRSTYANDPIR
jgi:hypothetical protein